MPTTSRAYYDDVLLDSLESTVIAHGLAGSAGLAFAGGGGSVGSFPPTGEKRV